MIEGGTTFFSTDRESREGRGEESDALGLEEQEPHVPLPMGHRGRWRWKGWLSLPLSCPFSFSSPLS